jgi:predicted peptidase
MVGWAEHRFEHNDFELPYQLYTPAEDPAPAPLVIYLHGTGAVGTDNQAQLYPGHHFGPAYFASAGAQQMQRAFVLAPQTPAPIRWASSTLEEYDWRVTPPTPSMAALLALLDTLKSVPAIDQRRIYLAGHSRGGQGVWNGALHRPHDFAALVPIAGAGSPPDAGRIAHVPLWAFHGDADPITPVTVTRRMLAALRAAGAAETHLRYTEIADGDHDSAWLEASKDLALWAWLLSWQRP